MLINCDLQKQKMSSPVSFDCNLTVLELSHGSREKLNLINLFSFEQVRPLGCPSPGEPALAGPAPLCPPERAGRRDSRGRQHTLGLVHAVHARVPRRFAPVRDPHGQQSLLVARGEAAGAVRKQLPVLARVPRRSARPARHPGPLLGPPRIQGFTSSRIIDFSPSRPSRPSHVPARLAQRACFEWERGSTPALSRESLTGESSTSSIDWRGLRF